MYVVFLSTDIKSKIGLILIFYEVILQPIFCSDKNNLM